MDIVRILKKVEDGNGEDAVEAYLEASKYCQKRDSSNLPVVNSRPAIYGKNTVAPVLTRNFGLTVVDCVSGSGSDL